MLASMEGHTQVVKILVKRGANVSMTGDGGITALHLAAQVGHLAVTVDLIKVGV